MPLRARLLTPIVIVLTLGSPVLAQEGASESPPGTPAKSGLEFRLTPGVWLARLKGESSFGQARAIDLDSQLDLNDLEPTFNFELELRKNERWQITLSGFDFSTNGGGVFAGNERFGGLTLDPGDAYTASLDFTTASVELAVLAWRPFAYDQTCTNDGRRVADLKLSPLVGVRYLDIDQRVETAAGGEVAEGEWLGVYGGLQAEFHFRPRDAMPLFDGLEMRAGAGIGPALGGNGGVVIQVRADVTWHATPNVGFSIGYRLADAYVEDGEFDFEAGLAGVFFAGVIRF